MLLISAPCFTGRSGISSFKQVRGMCGCTAAMSESKRLCHIGSETSLAHLLKNVNQPAPNGANPLCKPERFNSAFLGEANPSQLISNASNSDALLLFHRHAWLSTFKSSVFSYPHGSCCTLLGNQHLRTHLLMLVDPDVQEGADCLSSYLSLWGHWEGQWVYAEAGRKRKKEHFIHSKQQQKQTSKSYVAGAWWAN